MSAEAIFKNLFIMKIRESTLYDLLKWDILNLCFHADQNQGVQIWSRSHLSIYSVYTLLCARQEVSHCHKKLSKFAQIWYIIWYKCYQEYIAFTNWKRFSLPELAFHCPTELKPKFIISKLSNKTYVFWSYSFFVTNPTNFVIKEKITIHFNRQKVGLG